MSKITKNKQSSTYDQQGNQHAPLLPKINLHDAAAIRREIAAVYRDMRGGKIETQEGTRLAYVLDIIRKAFDTEVLQERLELLERTIEHRRKNHEK